MLIAVHCPSHVLVATGGSFEASVVVVGIVVVPVVAVEVVVVAACIKPMIYNELFRSFEFRNSFVIPEQWLPKLRKNA